jgi:hypothetical protein
MAFSILQTGNSLENAIARGEEAWLVTIAGWCERANYAGISNDLPAGCFPQWNTPALAQTFAGVAIGPYSDVDRAWLTYNAGPVFPVGGVNVDSDYASSIRRFSVDSPLLYQQSAGSPGRSLANVPIADGGGYPNAFAAQQNGLMYVFPEALGYSPGGGPGLALESTIIPLGYRLDTEAVLNGVVQPFTPLVNPKIQLQFFLRSGGAMQAPKRFPFQYGVYALAGVAGPAGTETRQIIVPIFGRKKVVVECANSGADAAWRVSTIRATNGRLTVPFEVTQGRRTGLAADESIYFELCEPCADWLILYVTPGANNTSVSYYITAYD